MAKTKKKSQVQIDYERERRRIQRYIRAQYAKGVLVPSNILPPVPKTITAGSVRRLQAITPKEILSRSTYLTEDFQFKQGIYGIQKATKGKRLEGLHKGMTTEQIRQRMMARNQALANEKAFGHEQKRRSPNGDTASPKASDSIIDNLEEILNKFAPPNEETKYMQQSRWARHTTIKGILNSAISEYGREALAQGLERSANAIITLVNDMLYKDSRRESYEADLSTFTAIIKGGPLTSKEAEDIHDLGESLSYDDDDEMYSEDEY